MPGWETIEDGMWGALAALELAPMQAEADKDFRLAIIGAPASGKTALACALAGTFLQQGTPAESQATIREYRLPLSVDDIASLEAATLLILLLDATKGDYVQEVAAADYLAYLGRPMLVCYSKIDLLAVEARTIRGQARWRGVQIVPLNVMEPAAVQELLVPALLGVLPEHALALARHLPLFRKKVLGNVIERAARISAAHASASGLATRVPRFGLPLTSEDLRMISGNQAAMAYRIGLACGLSPDWPVDAGSIRQAVPTGQLWQKLAREVTGMVPMWGLMTKVALTYGGTAVTGQAVRRWCETGEPMSPSALRSMCREAAAEARATSKDLVAKVREALPVPSQRDGVPAPAPARPATHRLQIHLPHVRFPGRPKAVNCPVCGRSTPATSGLCAHCGQSLVEIEKTKEG